MNNKLIYNEYKGCRDIITIDLHNVYTVVAIKIWKPDNQKYTVELRLKENSIEQWDLIEEAESLEFETTYKYINSAILKQVSQYLESGFFQYYIDRFNHYIKSSELGDEILNENGEIL